MCVYIYVCVYILYIYIYMYIYIYSLHLCFWHRLLKLLDFPKQ